MGASKRKRLIDEASQYVTKDRNTSYGEPEDNFQAIADLWNAQGVRLAVGTQFDSHRFVTSTDVALMMAGMKLARLKTNPGHRDSWVDLIGYAACGGDVALPAEDERTVAEMVKEYTADGMTIKAEDLEPDRVQPHDTIRKQREEAVGSIKGVGRWVSDNRCGERYPSPHEPHAYGTDAFDQPTRCVHSGACNWCDGYVVEPVSVPMDQVHRESDLDVVKRVADKLMSQGKAMTPRPIKDAPQA